MQWKVYDFVIHIFRIACSFEEFPLAKNTDRLALMELFLLHNQYILLQYYLEVHMNHKIHIYKR